MKPVDLRIKSIVERLGIVPAHTLEEISKWVAAGDGDEDLADVLLAEGWINEEQFEQISLEIAEPETGEAFGAEVTLLMGGIDMRAAIERADRGAPPTPLDMQKTQMLDEDELDGPAPPPPPPPQAKPAEEIKTLILTQDQIAAAVSSHEEKTRMIARPPEDPSQAATLVDKDPIPVSSAATETGAAGQSAVSMGSTRSRAAAEVSRARQMSADDVQRLQRVAEGQSDSLVGVNLAGYRIDGKLGSGGMGDVYLATQLSLNRQVALKVLPAQLARGTDFIDRFYQEARTLATITHNNIVQVYDVGEVEGLHFFTMEKVDGHTFKDLLGDEDGVPVAVLTNLMKQVIRGLSRAQQSGIIHRDIKPGNILINDAGDVKVVDFGLAERVEADGEYKSEAIVGTPLYISPEQAEGLPVTFKTDMYSLGATFFHLATGKPPYRGKTAYETTRLHTEAPIPNPSDWNSAVPPGFSAIIMRMMAKKADERFRDYKELFDAIEAFEIQTGIIKSKSDFLSDSLMAIGDRGVRGRVGPKVAFMSFVGLALALLAIGIHNTLKSRAMSDWIAMTGDIGTVFFALAVLFIAYVAMSRKKLVPVFGNIRTWMFAHIFCAIVSFFLVSIHSGNFFRFFWTSEGGVLGKGMQVNEIAGSRQIDVVPVIPFLNSLVFLIVIVSGLVGATIWRDIVKQVTVERIQQGKKALRQDTRLTMSVFSQTVFKYWRMIHYPLAVGLGLLTVLHVISILYYRGL